jgi:aryl-alcohol dehydrogenase
MRIRAAVIEQKGAPFTIEQLELDAPRANEVLVRIVAVGICQTDIHMQHQEYPVPFPIVLGHEASGIVENVGSGVSDIEPGEQSGFIISVLWTLQSVPERKGSLLPARL